MKNSKILMCLIMLLILSGCTKEETYNYTMKASYDIYYDESNTTTKFVSNEKIISENPKILKYFEYNFIEANDLFTDLDTYTSNITKNENEVYNDVSVDYSNIVFEDFTSRGIETVFFTNDKFDYSKFVSYLTQSGANCLTVENSVSCNITIEEQMDPEIIKSISLD